MISVGCGNSSSSKKTKQGELSATIFSQEKTVLRFWATYDFADTTLIHKPEISEQKFADFLVALSQADESQRNAAVDSLLTRSLRGGLRMFDYFAELSEKYLYNPNSPYRNEELYIPFLQYIVNCDTLDELNKIRPRYQLEMVLKNRPHEIAANFTYTLPNDTKGELHKIKSEYTLVFFNNPDCSDCKRVKEILSVEAIFTQNQKLKILAVYPDEDLSLWSKTTYPTVWINARCREVMENNIYDLKAIPTLYLLDKDKRVVLKDAPVEIVGAWLLQNIE